MRLRSIQTQLFTFILAVIANFSTSYADDKCQHQKNAFACVKYIKNYDADTITVNIPDLHPFLGEKMNIRVRGVDTPELRTKNACEKEKAKHAKKLVRNLLKDAKRIDLANIERGKYFRIVADVIIDGKNLTSYLIKNGLGHPYDGGTKPKVNWCKDLKTLAKEFSDFQNTSGRKAASEK